ncbi:unnamed protein product [Adineta steineri]|uniref:SUEL-type lectin domain-containing protein n=1 Tax=Adineta steineri TaxID=433720 RepID=A0A820B668_9BILA|nr:unnamed protein product [Adineta steineri]CAF4187449.1 unnamed protein product [Adineta steineri]
MICSLFIVHLTVPQSQPSILEYSDVNITCTPPTPTINILYACYGANDSSRCDCTTSACTQMNVTQYVALHCANSSTPSTCLFHVGGTFFVDTCSGVQKQLWLTYDCS